VHSGHYTKAKDYDGKKVVVIGACTSGVSTFVFLNKLSFI
jgi:cation diffusion facilitator CzcD-associated flavoprotein CzcO